MAVKLEIMQRLVRDRGARDVTEIPKPELAEDVACWPEEWREAYQERAGIMEFDGMLPRAQAEQWAETIVRAAYVVKCRLQRRGEVEKQQERYTG